MSNSLRPQDFPNKNSNIYQRRFFQPKALLWHHGFGKLESWRNSFRIPGNHLFVTLSKPNQQNHFSLLVVWEDFLLPAVFSVTPRPATTPLVFISTFSCWSSSHFLTYVFPSKWIQSSGIKQSWRANKFSHLLPESVPFCHYIHLLTRKFHLEISQLLHSSI